MMTEFGTEPSFRAYLHILRRRKWWVGLAAALGLGASLAFSLTAHKQYSSTAQLLVQPSVNATGAGTCTLTVGDSAGHVECWGQNDHGQVGNGTTNAVGDYVLKPATVSKLTGVTLIASHRNFTCAKNGDGQIYCWGQNLYGPLLGAGSSTTDITTPGLVVWD